MRKSIYVGLTILAALLGLTSAWMPPPFDSFGIWMMLVGFLFVILAGHRSAFRADDAGIFAFWWKPVKMATAPVHEADHWPLVLGLVATFSPLLSMLSRIVWMA
jgi:hypothetical protein